MACRVHVLTAFRVTTVRHFCNKRYVTHAWRRALPGGVCGLTLYWCASRHWFGAWDYERLEETEVLQHKIMSVRWMLNFIFPNFVFIASVGGSYRLHVGIHFINCIRSIFKKRRYI